MDEIMNSKELRIGNYVLCFDIESGSWCVDTVARLDAEIYTKDEIEAGCQCNDNVSPIPLTEEWLLKFGFEEDGRIDRIHDNFYSKHILDYKYCFAFAYFRNDWGFYQEYTDSPLEEDEGKKHFISCGIKHVHQLQNLYFALTNEELKLI